MFASSTFVISQSDFAQDSGKYLSCPSASRSSKYIRTYSPVTNLASEAPTVQKYCNIRVIQIPAIYSSATVRQPAPNKHPPLQVTASQEEPSNSRHQTPSTFKRAASNSQAATAACGTTSHTFQERVSFAKPSLGFFPFSQHCKTRWLLKLQQAKAFAKGYA